MSESERQVTITIFGRPGLAAWADAEQARRHSEEES